VTRVVVWFSCGAASAVAAQQALARFGKDRVLVVYCDLSRDEHPDNVRFRHDVAAWLDTPIVVIKSTKFNSIEEVFAARRYMSGRAGAPCTVEMKKVPRFDFQRADDLHVFGYTADEKKRIERFEANNPELFLAWVLRDAGITKTNCFEILRLAGIELPALYSAGFKNNNCIGCVKATSPKYWSLVRSYAPDVFARRATQSREIGCRLVRVDGVRVFLDELPQDDFTYLPDESISCGPECAGLPTDMSEAA